MPVYRRPQQDGKSYSVEVRKQWVGFHVSQKIHVFLSLLSRSAANFGKTFRCAEPLLRWPNAYPDYRADTCRSRRE